MWVVSENDPTYKTIDCFEHLSQWKLGTHFGKLAIKGKQQLYKSGNTLKSKSTEELGGKVTATQQRNVIKAPHLQSYRLTINSPDSSPWATSKEDGEAEKWKLCVYSNAILPALSARWISPRAPWKETSSCRWTWGRWCAGLCSFGKIQRFTQLVIQHRGDVFAASNDNVENDNYAVAQPFSANQENV